MAAGGGGGGVYCSAFCRPCFPALAHSGTSSPTPNSRCLRAPPTPSCELPGYIKSSDVIVDVSLQLTRSGGTRNHPLADQWWYPGGRGPADLRLYLDMVGTSLSFVP